MVALNLLKRAEKGAALSATEHDSNCTATEDALASAQEAISISQHDLYGRLSSGSGAGDGITVGDLTEEGTPAAGDFLVGWESGGALRKFDIGDLPASEGATPYLFEEFEYPENSTYSIVGYAPFVGTIATLRHFTSSGTCTVAIKIDGVTVTGLSAVSLSSTPGSATATANNSVSVGDLIEVTFSDALTGLPVRANLTLLFA